MGLQHWQMKRNDLFLAFTVGDARVHLIPPLKPFKHGHFDSLVIFSLTPRQIELKITTQLYEG